MSITHSMPTRADLVDAAASAIKDINDQLATCWNRGDAASYGELFTADADYIAVEGTWYHSREALVAAHQRLLDTRFRGTTLHGRITDVRLISPTIAIAHRVGSLQFPGEPTPPPEGSSIQTLVAVSDRDVWRFTAFQNTDIRNTDTHGTNTGDAGVESREEHS